MRKILFIFFCLCFFSLKSQATHIVGGEVRLIYLGTNDNYRIILNLYFDNINGSPTAVGQTLNVGIYSKTTRNRIEFFNLRQLSQLEVPYSSDACQTGTLSTKIIVYSVDVQLNPALYSDAGDYLMVWERCCRNNVITNIILPGAASNAFYAEFPAIRRAGQPFRNTSPDLGTPPSDYLCLNQTSSIKFGGTDPDGDVLVYSLVTPYNGTAPQTNPTPFESPTPPPNYPVTIPNIEWQSGFNATNAITSNSGQPLSINATTGQLSVNPNLIGLFVFSVKCEEFRNGAKIGEIKRDYQFLVRNCPINFPPILSVDTPQGNIYDPNVKMIMDLEKKDTTCFKLTIRDTPGDVISQIKIIPVSFGITSADYTISATRLPIDGSGVVVAYICWNTCKISRTLAETFIFDIKIFDGGCPVVGTDTKRITLFVNPKERILPLISVVGSTPNFDPITREANVNLSDSLRIDIEAKDIQNRLITLSAVGIGIDFTQYNASFTPKTGKGILRSSFRLTTSCDDLKAGEQTSIKIKFKVSQQEGCSPFADSLIVNIKIKDGEPNFADFVPYNAFTPNGDAKNAYYTLDNLPKESCIYNFRTFVVYNRWGKEVYQTTNKDFKWEAKNLPSGLYYYYLDYNQKKYKGYITVLY